MTQRLTKKIAYSKLQAFFNEKPMVLFGTGTSCAIDARFGMAALKEHLFTEIQKQSLTESQKKEWDEVVTFLQSSNDFEKAMDAINDSELIQLITNKTAAFLIQIEQHYAIKILKAEVEWPAIALFKRLVNGLPETDRKLHVATPNYDLLAEYAFEQANIPYLTGFIGGICRQLDWTQCERAVTYIETVSKGRKIGKVRKFKKHIRLYKVHGSLNTFKLNDQVVENNAWINTVPTGVERMMQTGTSKVEWLYQNRELLVTFDNAVKDHSSFLFLGFGFNDSQLNQTLKAKLKHQKNPGLIINRDSNESIEMFLNESDNLWLVCKHQDNNSTRIYNKQYENELYLKDKEIWKIEHFTREILGA
ncbi:MAG: SIR2 family protein [Candidatus Parabeggiatoa sp.]|nr:SIR2 family protein [Candidatus Parabeggiatoa sp.]